MLWAFLAGFATALALVVGGLVLILFAVKKSAKAELADVQSRLLQPPREAPPGSTDTTPSCIHDEWTCKPTQVVLWQGEGIGRHELSNVYISVALPVLFLTKGSKGGDRLGTVFLDSSSCHLTRKKNKKGTYLHRFHTSNYLRLTASRGALVQVADEEYTSMHIYLSTCREMDKWFTILQQGCQWNSPGRLSASRVGESWRAQVKQLLQTAEQSGVSAPEAAVNVAFGRIFHQWHTRPRFAEYIKKKINTKLRKLGAPKNLKGHILVAGVEVGPQLPVFSNVGRPTVTATGDVAVEADVRYSSGTFALTLEINFDISVANLSLDVPLPRVMARVQLVSFAGRLRVEVSSGDSPYLWLGFVGEPNLQLSVTTETPDLPIKLLVGHEIPELTDLVVTYLRSEVIQLMVLPRMEDLFLPLINENEEDDDTWVTYDNETVASPLQPDQMSHRSSNQTVETIHSPASASASASASDGGSFSLPEPKHAASAPVISSTPPPSPPVQASKTPKPVGKVTVNAKDLFKGFRRGSVSSEK